MRVTLLCLSLLIPICLIAQANGGHQQSPEWKAFYAKQDAFRARGTAALTAEYAREKAGDCPNAESRMQIDTCLQTEAATTQKNYDTYIRAIGGLLRLNAPGEAPEPTTKSPDLGKEFDAAEAAWSHYRETQCKAVGDYYLGGDMAGGAYLNCRQETIRRHMHDLEVLYGDLWH
jgi:uncharacterized protein YecT (DUF1311 family)